MSLDGRLMEGFRRATNAEVTGSDAALAQVIAAYHSQRRQRTALFISAAVVLTLVLLAGDRASRWVEGLERRPPPASENRGETGEDRERMRADDVSETNVVQGSFDRSARQDDTGSAPMETGEGSGIGSSSSRVNGDRAFGAVPGHSDQSTDDGSASGDLPDDGRDLTRYETKKWARPVGAGDPPPITFKLRRDERYFSVELDSTGGGGSSPVAGDIYEIVDGEARLLVHFCSESPTIEVRPRAMIEVHVDASGCNSTDVYLKGTVRVDFFR